jgi:hypothetical protein
MKYRFYNHNSLKRNYLFNFCDVKDVDSPFVIAVPFPPTAEVMIVLVVYCLD